ncbi:hypothetical protein [Lentzea cavernae]|uniref:Uncharacterized protein n=1 Tax=Lentzea cavernae TaxID=2020703 RepID=A0ABQ3MH96_9PSEU|nr:hypothetical protein [Lentzea cavernae]GHH46317.1 hypothetical protein GCM10017774_49070 [Lentzea cavernae]
MAPVKSVVPHPNANYLGQQHEEMKKLATEKYDPSAANQVSWNEPAPRPTPQPQRPAEDGFGSVLR